MELSDGIERPLGMGVAVDQYATKYFINPLNDDAKDALRHVNKKNQKLKAKKQKKKASLPKSNLKQDPKSNASPSTSKKVKSKDSADAPTKRDKKARLRQEVAKARLRQEVAELKEDIPESMAKAAADTLVQLSGQSAEHNREQKQKIEGNAEGKVERKRRKKEKLNKFLKARTQQLFSQVSGSNATPLSVLGRGSCRLDPISID
jgi:ABC-type Na+ efflux pump permease subunit